MLNAIQNNIAAAIGFMIGALAAVIVMLFVYEGIPIGPLARVPFLGPILADWTGGLVDAARREALQGYVIESRAIAAESQLAETKRQLEAGRKAAKAYAELLSEAQAKLADQAIADDAAIAEYEKLLGDRGRLTADDVDFILRRQ